MGKGSGGILQAMMRALEEVDGAATTGAALRAALRGAIDVWSVENSILTPNISLPKLGRQKFNEIPSGINNFGDIVTGHYGARLARTKGDYVEINQSRYNIRQQAAETRKEIYDTANSLQGQAKQNYLDDVAIDLDQSLLDLRDQYQLYGTNSVQARVLDQSIRSKVHLLNEVEKLAGYRDINYDKINSRANRAGGTDYNYTPENGQFGRRANPGTMTNDEKGAMQNYRDVNKAYRGDFYDSHNTLINKSDGSSLQQRRQLYQETWNTLSSKVEFLSNQRELYRGTDWKRTLDYEILRDLKVLKTISDNDSNFQFNQSWNNYLPQSLRNQL